VIYINLTERQKKIIEIVKNADPITSREIAERLDLTRGALRSDLSILTMANILEAKPHVGYFYTKENSYLRDFDDLYGKKIEEIKSAPIVIKQEISIYDAIVHLFLKNTGSLFVIDQDEVLIGVVARKDLLKISMGKSEIKQLPVSIVMTRMPNLITITNETTIFEAAKLIVKHQIDTLPVVEKIDNNRHKVIGKVSKTNIVRSFVDFGLKI